MARQDINCEPKPGCQLIWACVINGIPNPIGRVTAGSINSSESSDEGQFFGGTCSNDQSDIEKNPDGTLVSMRRFEILDAEGNSTKYNACTDEEGCTHDVSLTANYCFAPTQADAEQNANCDPVTRSLFCGGTCDLALYQLNPNGSLTQLFLGRSSRITSKNRNLATGANTDSTFQLSFTTTDASFSGCFH